MENVVVFALPVFGLLMAIEFVYGLISRRNTYALSDTLSSLSQGLLSQVVAACTQVIQIGLYTMAWPFLTLTPDAALWHRWEGIALAVLLYDFCDYWLHRVSHESAIFWAAHVVHHQSQHFNLSTALRQESAYALSGWMFFFPMALAGVPPHLFAVAGLVVLFYQFWIHTEHIGSLGIVDRIFSTPSNHRVHHAINDRYIDRNYGAILVVWDRLFGTFEPESEACAYGTRVPLASWDPLRAVGGTYVALFGKFRRTRGWGNKVGVLFRSPSWEAPAATIGVPDWPSTGREFERYDPPTTAVQCGAALAIFALATAATAALLFEADTMGPLMMAAAAAAIAALLWTVGAVLERKNVGAAAIFIGVLLIAVLSSLSRGGSPPG